MYSYHENVKKNIRICFIKSRHNIDLRSLFNSYLCGFVPRILLTMTILWGSKIKSAIAQPANYRDESRNQINYPPPNSADEAATSKVESTTTDTPDKICIDVNDSVTTAEFSDASGSIFQVDNSIDTQQSDFSSDKSQENRCVNDS